MWVPCLLNTNSSATAVFAQEAGLHVTGSSDLSRDVTARVREAVHAGDIKTGKQRLLYACAIVSVCV